MLREPMVPASWIRALALVSALAACRTTRVEPLLSDSAVMLDLPLVRQDELYDCGLVAMSALCQYWNVPIPPEQRADLAKRAADEKGLSGGELRQALESDGMEVFLFHGTLDRGDTGLYGHLDAGRPLLVMVSPGGDMHHYCLVLGYDEPKKNVVLLDPARGQVIRPIAAFERGWESCQRFTLLATPRNGGESLPAPRATGPSAQNPSKEN
jgi:ABC-type bacteriocin/lantibiotic exporter with double-glycine peptidase domain